ncbi:hypothetical protein DFP72DRAFT_880124 [Ephemerocybe angulata]|uniref:TEA domain-containing protein n=1 Tax=Ephemerocybe angulata TaxID=980116 RepID=A0A8H6I8Y7_9AGAR|nr:hypothetical protein DFP72DRAFT_880124 [Tulosesus angulatus]
MTEQAANFKSLDCSGLQERFIGEASSNHGDQEDTTAQNAIQFMPVGCDGPRRSKRAKKTVTRKASTSGGHIATGAKVARGPARYKPYLQKPKIEAIQTPRVSFRPSPITPLRVSSDAVPSPTTVDVQFQRLMSQLLPVHSGDSPDITAISTEEQLEDGRLSVEQMTIPEIYLCSLLGSGRGLPCWQPSPQSALRTGKDRGVVPGDVGIYSVEEGFRKLFNLWEDGAAIQERARLSGETYELPERAVTIDIDELSRGDIIASPGISSHMVDRADGLGPAQIKFRCESRQGAVVIPTSAAEYEELTSHNALRKTLIQSAGLLYMHAKSLCEMDNGESLYIVTGAIKCESWALAAFREPLLHYALRLDNKPAPGRGRVAPSSWARQRQWSYEAHVGISETAQVMDQSLFLRGYKMAFSQEFREQMDKRLVSGSPKECSGSDGEPDFLKNSTLDTIEMDSLDSASGLKRSEVNEDDAPDGVDFRLISSKSRQSFHPSDSMTTQILQKTGAKVALVHDDNWRFALKGAFLLGDENAKYSCPESQEIAVEKGVAYLPQNLKSVQPVIHGSGNENKQEQGRHILGDVHPDANDPEKDESDARPIESKKSPITRRKSYLPVSPLPFKRCSSFSPFSTSADSTGGNNDEATEDCSTTENEKIKREPSTVCLEEEGDAEVDQAEGNDGDIDNMLIDALDEFDPGVSPRSSPGLQSPFEDVFECPNLLDNSSPLTRNVFQSVRGEHQDWRIVEGGEALGEALWPPELETALIEGLENYIPDESGETKLLRQFSRNRFISDWIYVTTGRLRTGEQVGMRLQQLKNSRGEIKCLKRLTPSQLHADLQRRYCNSALPESPPSSVAYIELLSTSDITVPKEEAKEDESKWETRGIKVVRLSTQARHISNIDPTITFTSPTPISETSVLSIFSVYYDDVLVHSEDSFLVFCGLLAPDTGPRLYSTRLLPEYWSKLCGMPDVSRYTIVHRVVEETSPAGGTSEDDFNVLFSTMYRFRYATRAVSPSPIADVCPS